MLLWWRIQEHRGGECVTVKISNQAESFMCTKNRMHELSRNFILCLQLSRFFEVLKAHKAKSTLHNSSWLLLTWWTSLSHCYPGLTVQEVKINREDEDGEKQLVVACSRKFKGSGMGLAHIVFSQNRSSPLRFFENIAYSATECAFL